MKRLILTSALILTLFSTSALASGVIVDMSGRVDVKMPDKSEVRAMSGTELPDGSIVSVAKGGSASIMLINGAIDEVESGSTYKVGERVAGKKRTELGGGIGKAMRELVASGKGPTVHGMVREAKGPQRTGSLSLGLGGGLDGLYPRRTTIVLGEKIVFTWNKSFNVNWKNPVLIIDDANDKHIAVLPIKPSSKKYSTTPVRIHIVKGRKYEWYLGSGRENPKRKSAKSPFRTLSSAKEKRYLVDKKRITSLKMSLEGRNILLAQLDFQYKLYDDQVAILLPIWKTNKSSFVKKLLFLGYHKMGSDKEVEFR